MSLQCFPQFSFMFSPPFLYDRLFQPALFFQSFLSSRLPAKLISFPEKTKLSCIPRVQFAVTRYACGLGFELWVAGYVHGSGPGNYWCESWGPPFTAIETNVRVWKRFLHRTCTFLIGVWSKHIDLIFCSHKMIRHDMYNVEYYKNTFINCIHWIGNTYRFFLSSARKFYW